MTLKEIIILALICYSIGVYTGWRVSSNNNAKLQKVIMENKEVIRELATVICIANNGVGGCIDDD